MSDLVFSALSLPQIAAKFFSHDWILGGEFGFFCQLFPVLFYGNSAVTLFSLMAVTLNRWALIHFPKLGERMFTRRRSKVLVAACWLLPPAMLLPSLSGLYGHHGLDYCSRSCTIKADEKGHNPKDVFLVCGLVIPCCVLFFTNVSIYKKVSQPFFAAIKNRF